MSEIRLNLLDANRTIHGTTHAGNVDVIVAALSACPETIEDLERAMSRFSRPVPGTGPFDLFDADGDDTPWDAGIAFVDLAARVLACESTYSSPQSQGAVYYRDGEKQTDVRICYSVPDDWLLLDSVEEYRCLRDLRRTRNSADPPLDARAVIYGALARAIVPECLAARDAGVENPVAGIHAKWLMTPREDLRGNNPRTVLLTKQDFIDADLQSREDQWSRLGAPPPCLDPGSAAYRFAGFGTHEIVVYYDLVRYLIAECWESVRDRPDASAAEEVQRLERLQSEWLERPEEDFEGKSAATIIECERKRLPLAVPPETMYEDHCPLCRSMVEDGHPAFCHFDGCNMDDGFPFSFCLTPEEWRHERLSDEDFYETVTRAEEAVRKEMSGETSPEGRRRIQ